MQEDIKVKLHEAYEKLIEAPRKVQEIFNDFYGEERVDLQGIPSYDNFEEILKNTCINSLINGCWSDIMEGASDEAKTIIESLDNNACFTDSLSIASYILPLSINILKESLNYHPFILVYFPYVRVTNENDKFVDIQDLYAKVPITMNGQAVGAFFLNRSTYPVAHLQADYMHSHSPGLNLGNLSDFKSVCMGSGPIRTTMVNLSREFDDGLWQLFCLELDKFTKVESLRGIPYRRLEEIGRNAQLYKVNTRLSNVPFRLAYPPIFTREDSIGFIKWLIERKALKFNLCDKGFALAHTYYDTMLRLSNEFLKYWNTKIMANTTHYHLDDLINTGVLYRYIFKDGILCRYSGVSGRDFSRYEGLPMFLFKGKTIKFHIINEVDPNEVNNEVLWLDESYAQNILRVILEILNYNYGREERREEVTSSGEGRYYI